MRSPASGLSLLSAELFPVVFTVTYFNKAQF